MISDISESAVQNKESTGSLNKIWYCKQCGTVEKLEADFAKHLRSHFKGHRARSTRRTAKSLSNGITGNVIANGISITQNPTSLLKFDNISTRQLEITQPNTVTNLMTINGDDICERLVDPSLVMPTKIYQEPINFTTSLDAFSRSTEKIDTKDTFSRSIEKNQNGDDFSLNEITPAAAKALSEKEITLQILDDILIESSTDFKGASLTKPLQLFYVSADNSLNVISDKATQDVEDNRIAENSVNEMFELNPDDAFDVNLNSDCISDDNLNGVSSKDDYEASLICEICQKNFKTSAYLYRHLRKHTGEFKCGTCSTTFARKETWITHRCFGKNMDKDSSKPTDFLPSETPTLLVAKPEGSLPAMIPTNNTTDDSAKATTNTSKSTSDVKRRAMECPTCGVTLSDASCLKRHMLTHDRAPCYTCVYCTAVVQHRHSIRRHLRLHHPEYEHEWNNRAFITSLQTEDTERRFSTSTHKRIANTKKKKNTHGYQK